MCGLSALSFEMCPKWEIGLHTTKISNDSFYIRTRVVYYYTMGSNTVYFNVSGYAISDVFAMPKKGYLIYYKNGHFQISTSEGHVHLYWVKSRWILRAGAIGYAALNVVNGFINNNFSFAGSKLGIAVGVFLFGVLLQQLYKPTLRLGKKYHLEIINLSN